MIKGHGIDLQSMAKIAQAYAKNERFATKILTPKELEIFANLSEKRQIEYLAGRWSAKEAFAKAWGTGIGQIAFLDLEILNDQSGAPIFTKHPFAGQVWVSISHSEGFVQTSVLLEGKDD
ncbi:holo-ACP synthase [Streptococcus ovuberis]|uniref:Holo-[acyl-carrier-protein] synthase n=1 Tax=Streptococcus ovuberis TaxID=1936207 RepID=A0A7X6S078_9STRE|nr:holo-ACP synthase [Streptococcus ovuberis]NKZ19938.1 holo-ACP synthase [Streptococcus ovuberis]